MSVAQCRVTLVLMQKSSPLGTRCNNITLLCIINSAMFNFNPPAKPWHNPKLLLYLVTRWIMMKSLWWTTFTRTVVLIRTTNRYSSQLTIISGQYILHLVRAGLDEVVMLYFCCCSDYREWSILVYCQNGYSYWNAYAAVPVLQLFIGGIGIIIYYINLMQIFRKMLSNNMKPHEHQM